MSTQTTGISSDASKIAVSSKNFKTSYAVQGFKWCEEDMQDIPVVKTPDGTIFEPLMRYFAYGWLHRRFKSKTSMRPVMYSLRDWFSFLMTRGVDWFDVTDATLREYRISLVGQAEAGCFSRVRIPLKLEHVFDFYAVIPRAMPFLNRVRMKVFADVIGKFAPITAVDSKRGLKWSGAEAIRAATPKRPTPDSQDVERIEGHLRSHVFGRIGHSWPEMRAILLRERNWLIARCQARAGLRRAEVANLSLEQISAALAKQGIISLPADKSKCINPIASACGDQEMQCKILERIDAYRNKGYTTLNVVVRKKGGGDRSVEFPIDLIVDILEISVWSFRNKLSERFQSAAINYDRHTLFFSFGNIGSPLKEGSIGDIVNDAFKELGIAGSGHRLRAYYLTQMAWLLWNQNLALNGYRNDASVENQTLNRLADLAGHAQPGTVERHYLDIAQLLHASRQNKPKLDAASEVLNALRLACPVLPADDLRRIERLISALSTEDDRLLRAMLDGVVERYAPRPKTAVTRVTDQLRIIDGDKT